MFGVLYCILVLGVARLEVVGDKTTIFPACTPQTHGYF